MALALPADGRPVRCDVSAEWTAVAQRYWAEAGVAEHIDLRLAPALDTLDRLLEDGQAGSFDFTFMDADKENYPTYYERLLELLRPGGLLAIDNVFWGGEIIRPDVDDDAVRAVRRLNETLATDERVTIAMLPIADGLTLARKR